MKQTQWKRGKHHQSSDWVSKITRAPSCLWWEDMAVRAQQQGWSGDNWLTGEAGEPRWNRMGPRVPETKQGKSEDRSEDWDHLTSPHARGTIPHQLVKPHWIPYLCVKRCCSLGSCFVLGPTPSIPSFIHLASTMCLSPGHPEAQNEKGGARGRTRALPSRKLPINQDNNSNKFLRQSLSWLNPVFWWIKAEHEVTVHIFNCFHSFTISGSQYHEIYPCSTIYNRPDTSACW